MREFRLIHSRSRLNISRSPTEIRDQVLPELCTDNGVRYDRDSMTGVWRGQLVSALYEWELEADPETSSYVVRQQVRLSTALSKFQAISTAVWTIVWGVLYLLQTSGTISVTVITVAAIATVLVMVGLYIAYISVRSIDGGRYPDPLVDGQPIGFGYRRFSPTRLRSPLGKITLLSLVGAVVVDDPQVTAILGGSYVTVSLALLAAWYVDGGERLLAWMERSFVGEMRVSGLARRYVSYTVQLTGIVVFIPIISELVRVGITQSYWLDGDQAAAAYIDQAPHSVPLLDELGAVLLALVAWTMYRQLGDEELVVEYFDFKNRGQRTFGRVVDASSVLISTVLLYFSLGKTTEILLGLQIGQLPESFLSLPLLLFVGAVLPLYFPAGIVYQHVERVRRIRELIEHSTSETVTVAGYEAEVRLLHSETHYATSFTTHDGTGWLFSHLYQMDLDSSYIVVSEGLRSDLDEQAFAAVVAHEEGHIEYGDTWLCNAISIASTVLLTGENVLYDMVNFYQREHQADMYACEAVGTDAVQRALSFLRDSENTDDGVDSFGANFTPQFNPDSAGQVGESFELFFGGFALSDAHPSIDDRLARLPNDAD